MPTSQLLIQTPILQIIFIHQTELTKLRLLELRWHQHVNDTRNNINANKNKIVQFTH